MINPVCGNQSSMSLGTLDKANRAVLHLLWQLSIDLQLLRRPSRPILIDQDFPGRFEFLEFFLSAIPLTGRIGLSVLLQKIQQLIQRNVRLA